jgi:capsular polysaccharide transport system permease protein
MKYAEPPRIEEIELQPVHAKGELVVDNWWQPEISPEVIPFHRKYMLELITIAAPLAFAAVYLLFIAAPRFVSESEFMVRTLGSSDMGNLATLLTDQKVTRASDETFAVSAYMTSRDAVDTLVKNDRLRDILGSPEADFINRFPNMFTRDNRERLYWHFQDYVDLTISSESGIAKLDAIAFTPQDALALNKAMLRNAEEFVNKLNTRIFDDSLTIAAADVEAQKTKFTEIEARLTAYRNAESVLDPSKEVSDTLTRIGADDDARAALAADRGAGERGVGGARTDRRRARAHGGRPGGAGEQIRRVRPHHARPHAGLQAAGIGAGELRQGAI